MSAQFSTTKPNYALQLKSESQRQTEEGRVYSSTHFVPEVPLVLQLPLQQQSSVLSIVRLLLQSLDLPLHGV